MASLLTTPVFLSYSRCHMVLRTLGLQTARVYYLTVLEVGSLKRVLQGLEKCPPGHIALETLGENRFLDFQFLRAGRAPSSTRDHTAPAAISIFLSPDPRRLPLPL